MLDRLKCLKARYLLAWGSDPALSNPRLTSSSADLKNTGTAMAKMPLQQGAYCRGLRQHGTSNRQYEGPVPVCTVLEYAYSTVCESAGGCTCKQNSQKRDGSVAPPVLGVSPPPACRRPNACVCIASSTMNMRSQAELRRHMRAALVWHSSRTDVNITFRV